MFSRISLIACSLCFICGTVFATTALDSVPDENDLPFRIGNNPCYYGGYWDDAQATRLSARGGLDGQRKKLPEQHLVTWGYGIEVGDCKTANSVGVYDLIGYLATPSKEHSTDPDHAESHPPKNLYKPIFVNGEVNPDNYWASYVNKTVWYYKDYVRIWEVYNEPDYRNWDAKGDWETDPPYAKQLPYWNGDIFEYNRLMRITYEVVKSIDPTAWVAPGGLGYSSFLDAMLRYTDNPTDGSVTSEYPLHGGAYFDCLSYHQYPMYGQTDEKTGIGYHNKGSDNLAMKFVTIKKNMEYRLEKYGFNGTKYPRKMFICSETGLSDVSFGDHVTKVGGDLVRRNYVLKQMLYAREYGVKQSQWFCVADYGGDNVGGHMGDFYSITGKTVETARMKDSTKGRLVWKNMQLGKMNVDFEKTQATRNMLANLKDQGNNLTALVFTRNNRTWPFSKNETVKKQPSIAYVFWRRCDYDHEVTEKVKLTLDMGGPCDVVRYDGSVRTYTDTFTIKVDGTPVFIVPAGEYDVASSLSVALLAVLLLVVSIFII